jgi:AI-2 transport protein TqsA
MPQTASNAVIRDALVFLAVIAAGAALYWLADILAPLALAVFMAVMINGFARELEARLPVVSRRAATPLAVALSVGLFAGAVYVIADIATGVVGEFSGYGAKLNELIARTYGAFGVATPPVVGELVRRLDPARYIGQVALAMQGLLATAAFVLVYLGFLLASRRGWERKVVALFPVREERHEFLQAFLRITAGVEKYLWVQTVTGLMIAAASWLAMTLVGLDHAVFWAFVIFLASYIPVVGGVVGVMVPPVFALLQFDSFWPAVTLLVVLQTVTLFVGNVVQPRMQGRSLNIDPVAVLLALAFWGAIWGLVGAFLSTPLTVMIMVILAQFQGTRWVAVLLSEDGNPAHINAAAPAKTKAKPRRGNKETRGT